MPADDRAPESREPAGPPGPRIGRHEEIVEANETVDVTLLGSGLRPADLVIIGSHCIGLDLLLGELHELGFMSKFIAVGSTKLDRRGFGSLAPEPSVSNLGFIACFNGWRSLVLPMPRAAVIPAKADL